MEVRLNQQLLRVLGGVARVRKHRQDRFLTVRAMMTPVQQLPIRLLLMQFLVEILILPLAALLL
jgi:hypothetical protein